MVIRPGILGVIVASHPKTFCKLPVHFHRHSVEDGRNVSIFSKTPRHAAFHKTMKSARMLTPDPSQEIGHGGCTEQAEELTSC